MPKDNLSEFHQRVLSEANAGRVDECVAVIRGRLREAESQGNEEDALLLYSMLLDVYALTQDDSRAREVQRERESKHPRNLDIKMSEAERLFWVDRDFGRALEKAEAIAASTGPESHVYYKSVHLRGLCYLELNDASRAVEMLRQSQYYDLTLAERLIARDAGKSECREFLLRALEKHRQWRVSGEDVGPSLSKIEALLALVSRPEDAV